MGVRGAVYADGQLVVTDELQLRPPGPHEVRVQVLSSGVCHSDVTVMARQRDAPIVLGHEAAGLVAECGSAVEAFRIGDAVAVGSQRPCGSCRWCQRGRYSQCPTTFVSGDKPFTWRGRGVYSMARVSSFSTQIVVHESQLIEYQNLSSTAAALIGCAVTTGYGNVFNVAEVGPGDTVVVIGVGGIGVNAIQAARLAGATRVIAMDVAAHKEQVAVSYGAHQFVLIDRDDAPGEVAAAARAAAGAVIDAVLECSGVPSATESAVRAVGRGGRVAVVGHPAQGATASFDINALMIEGKSIRGALNGACDPFIDLPEVVRLAESGALSLERQVSEVWPLGQIHDAIQAMLNGEVVRAGIDMTR